MKRIAADTLIELSLATLRDELAQHLPAEKRYAAAMIANALEIARREVKSETEQPLWALLDQLYEEGEGSPAELARDIRAGKVTTARVPDLADRLLAMVTAELEVKNPRFLVSRRG